MERFAVRPGYQSEELLVEFWGSPRNESFPDVRRILEVGLSATQKKHPTLDTETIALRSDQYISYWEYTRGAYELDDDTGGYFILAPTNNRQVISDIERVLLASDRFEKVEVDFQKYTQPESSSPPKPPMKIERYPPSSPWVGKMSCSTCNTVTAAWRSSGLSECSPHFYCDRCSNVIHRSQDAEIYQDAGASQTTLEQIATSLPSCPCGGRFQPGANPNCPHCETEFAHPSDAISRMSDPHMIALHGASVFIGENQPYQVLIEGEPDS